MDVWLGVRFGSFAYAGPGVRGTTFMEPASENLHNSGKSCAARTDIILSS